MNRMKLTSKQVNALYEVTADTDEPIYVAQTKKGALKVKIGKGKSVIHWRIAVSGTTLALDEGTKSGLGYIVVQPEIKPEPDAKYAERLKVKAKNEAEERAQSVKA